MKPVSQIGHGCVMVYGSQSDSLLYVMSERRALLLLS